MYGYLNKHYKLTPAVKALAVITAALLTGFMWRVRGDHGFGSMWGMFAVAGALCLLIFGLFGKREKMTYEMLPLSVLAMAVTVGGWGTLNSQMSGLLGSGTAFMGEAEARLIAVNPLSGLFVMLCLGFGWMPLFACLLGSLFSKKSYNAGNYIFIVAIYWAVLFICRASISHLIVRLACPDACHLFADGLYDKGFMLTPFKAYLTHFASEGWAKLIPGGRNYYASINVVSATVATAVILIWQRFALKDRLASLLAFGVNTISAIAITAADFFLVIGERNNIFHIYTVPEWIAECRWSLWEFFTGFLLGLGIMLMLVLLPDSVISGNAAVKNNLRSLRVGTGFAYHTLLTSFFVAALVFARAAGLRITEQIRNTTDLPKLVYSVNTDLVIAVILGAVALIICAAAVGRNMLRRRLPVPFPMQADRFARRVLPLHFTLSAVIYFFTGNAYFFLVKWKKITPSTFFATLREGWASITIIMAVSAILIAVLLTALTVIYNRSQAKMMSSSSSTDEAM